MGVTIDGRKIGRIAVLGFGTTGRALVEFAIGRRLSPIVSEARPLAEADREWLAERGVEFEDGGHTDGFLARAEAIVLSPGVPPSIPPLQMAMERGIPVLSEIDLACSLISPPIVAVTGTNGKSSVVTLIGYLLEGAGEVPIVAGNIGMPAISIVDTASSASAVVLEVSSYQLEQSGSFRPRIGILLNLAPDHLHRHGTMEAYAAAKGRLFQLQTPEDVAILPSALADLFDQGAARRIFFDTAGFPLPPYFDSLPPHERENLKAAAASMIALIPDFDPAAIPEETLRAAFGLPHRLEEVGTVGGVRVINDSKSTNPASAIAALRATEGDVVLLIGGRSKGAGYEDLAREVGARPVRAVITYGEAAGELSALLARFGIETAVGSDLEEGISLSLAAAGPGDTFLFSPACSSFDQFTDFAERGEEFVRFISRLPGFSQK